VSVVPRLVFCETGDELAVDPGRARDDSLRQSTGLVGADYTGAGHCLARTESAEKQIIACHALCDECQGERNGTWKTWIYVDGYESTRQKKESHGPSGTATKIKDEDKIRMLANAVPFSIGVLVGDERMDSGGGLRTHRFGTGLPSWMKNRIISTVKRKTPTAMPSLAIQ
jgi:hypothetical protein